MTKQRFTLATAAVLALAATGAAWAQKSTADGIAEYRKMLEDGNPAELFEAKGAELWVTKRGPRNTSLAQCDLGKGPGVVKGPSSSCRATSPTRRGSRTWSRAW